MRLALVVLMVIGSRAAADPCKGAEPILRSISKKLEQLTKHSGEAIVQCTFHGPDAKLVEKLQAEGKTAGEHEQAITKFDKCKVNPIGATPITFVAAHEQWAGDRLNAAIAVCGGKDTKAATGPDCKTEEEFSLQFLGVMESAASGATDLAVTCGFKGANDKAIAKVPTATHAKLKPLMDNTPKKPVCSAQGMKLLEDEALTSGQRFGFAFTMCSSKARAKAAALAKAGKTDSADLSKAVEPLVTPWAAQIYGK